MTDLGTLSEEERLAVECLVLIQTLDATMASYLRSGGQLYGDLARNLTQQFLASYQELCKHDPQFLDPKVLNFEDQEGLDRVISELEKWAATSEVYLFGDIRSGTFWVWRLLHNLRAVLQIKLALNWKRMPALLMHPSDIWKESHADAFLAEAAKVLDADQTHAQTRSQKMKELLKEVLDGGPPEAERQIRAASESTTIVAVGDIRSSQDLMTYAVSADDFIDRMRQFVDQARQIIQETGGYFDKFTGDGFIAHFNKDLPNCREDILSGFSECVGRLVEFSQGHFSKWTRTIQKHPGKQVGLAIGGDLGRVEFDKPDQEGIIAIGEPIVWASRMCSEAQAHEVMVNNRLYNFFKDTGVDAFKERKGKTKAGESFTAWMLKLPLP